jgi:stalled ribosome rescue protein Dom34
MTINAGIWIDHHKAIVVLLTDGDETTEVILADAEATNAPAAHNNDRDGHTQNDFFAEENRERKAMIHFVKHYDNVIAHLHHADSIFIMGPGEAKGEFGKRIEEMSLKGRVSHIEPADKMSDRQVAVHVREAFGATANRKN